MNKVLNESDIELCGETYTLRASFKGLSEIESRAQKSLYALMVDMSKADITFTNIAAIVFGGLKGSNQLFKKDGKMLSYDDVGNMCQKNGYSKLLKPCSDFLAMALAGDPDVKPEDVNEKKTEPTQTN